MSTRRSSKTTMPGRSRRGRSRRGPASPRSTAGACTFLLTTLLAASCCCPFTPPNAGALAVAWAEYWEQGDVLLYGKIVDQDGNPVPDAWVDADYSRVTFGKALFGGHWRGKRRLQTVTDAEGRFTIDGGAGGKLIVRPTPGGRYRLLKEGHSGRGRKKNNSFIFTADPRSGYVPSYDAPAIYVFVDVAKLRRGEVDLAQLQHSRGGTTNGRPTGDLVRPVEPELK